MMERWVAAAALALSALLAPSVVAQPTPPRPPATLSVASFDGGWNLPVWAAQRAYKAGVDWIYDKGGISRTLALDPGGIRTVLELRSRYGTPRKTLTDPSKYVDTSYLRKALD